MVHGGHLSGCCFVGHGAAVDGNAVHCVMRGISDNLALELKQRPEVLEGGSTCAHRFQPLRGARRRTLPAARIEGVAQVQAAGLEAAADPGLAPSARAGVKLSGATLPCDLRRGVSSPVSAAAFIASSVSPRHVPR